MVMAISKLGFLGVNGINAGFNNVQCPRLFQTTNAPKAEQLSASEMAAAIRRAKKDETIPTIKDIFEKFYRGELDPRKNGEFKSKVIGRDDSVRIYVGKNKKGEDCVCVEYRKKHTECNIYSTLHVRLPFERYDKIVEELKKHPSANYKQILEIMRNMPKNK